MLQIGPGGNGVPTIEPGATLAVPEPATCALSALGGYVRRRKA